MLETVCQCDHLTNFGLLFDINGVLDDWSPYQMAILNILTIVLCSLSILASLVTLLILQISRLPSSPRIQIVKNRALSMVALYLLFLVGFDKTTFNISNNLCIAFAALIHFSGLAIFFWTLLEGLQLLRTISSNNLTDTNTSKYSTLVRYLVGYGTPLIFTFLAVFISHIIQNDAESYLRENSNYCWLQEESFIWFYI